MDNPNGLMGAKTALITGGTPASGEQRRWRWPPWAPESSSPDATRSVATAAVEDSAAGRVVTSEGQRGGSMDFGDVQSRRGYRAMPLYGMTKLVNIMFTCELVDRPRGTGVTANCLRLGGVNTNFGTNNSSPTTLLFRAFKPFMLSPEQGADTLIWLASSPEVEGISGRYLSDRKETEAKKVAYDPDAPRRLWEISEDLTGPKVEV